MYKHKNHMVKTGTVATENWGMRTIKEMSDNRKINFASLAILPDRTTEKNSFICTSLLSENIY